MNAYQSKNQALVKISGFTFWQLDYNAFVPKCGRRNAEVQVVKTKGFVTGMALAEEPTFHNVFRLPVNRSVPKNKVTLH